MFWKKWPFEINAKLFVIMKHLPKFRAFISHINPDHNNECHYDAASVKLGQNCWSRTWTEKWGKLRLATDMRHINLEVIVLLHSLAILMVLVKIRSVWVVPHLVPCNALCLGTDRSHLICHIVEFSSFRNAIFGPGHVQIIQFLVRM